MPVVLNSRWVDIDQYPTIIKSSAGITELTLGDLNASVIKLLYSLIHEGVCQLPEDDYQRLLRIYKYPTKTLTRQHLAEFNHLIGKITVTNKAVLLRLIGDELGDRGNNDYFVLKLLQKLTNEGLKLDILFSNHGAEFVHAYEHHTHRNSLEGNLMEARHTRSLANFNVLYVRGLVLQKELFSIIEEVYKPALNLLSYSLDETTRSITIYSHAGIGLETIQALANKFDVAYFDDTAGALAMTITNINKAFREHVSNNTVHQCLSRQQMMAGYDYLRSGFCLTKTPYNNAVEFTLWNRQYPLLQRPNNHQGYSIAFVHGHDSDDPGAEHIYNLDSPLGQVAEPANPLDRLDYTHHEAYKTLVFQGGRTCVHQPPTPTNHAFKLKCLLNLGKALLALACVALIVLSVITANPIVIAFAAGLTLATAGLMIRGLCKNTSSSNPGFFAGKHSSKAGYHAPSTAAEHTL